MNMCMSVLVPTCTVSAAQFFFFFSSRLLNRMRAGDEKHRNKNVWPKTKITKVVTRNWYFEMYVRACNSSSNLRSDSHFFNVLVHPRRPLCSGTARRHATEETWNRCSSVLPRDVLERHACHSGSGHDMSERHACSKD